MAFTNDLSTDIGKVRFELDDLVQASALFPEDASIEHALSETGGSVLLAAAKLCDVLVTRFSHGYDFSTDGQSFKRSQRAEAFRKLAQGLRERQAGGNVGVLRVERESAAQVEEDFARFPEGLHGPPLGSPE